MRLARTQGAESLLQHEKDRNKRRYPGKHHQTKYDPVWKVRNPVASKSAKKENSCDASGFDEFVTAVGSEDTPERDPIY